MKKNNAIKLAVAIIVSELAGIIGSVFTSPSIPNWYATLVKPSFNPPSWIFGPVWTTLFVLMGIAAFLVWKKGLQRKDVKIALSVFIGQLLLNTLWSIIFFGLHNPMAAFVEIIFLWLAIVATMILFARSSRASVWLLVPYILWVSFAGFLNFTIADLNKPSNAIVPAEQGINQPVGMANPASVNCTALGGTLVIQTKPDGGQYGLCYFDDARACEEWAMMRGECIVGGQKTTGYDTEEQRYCAWLGGHTSTNQAAVCTFSDSSTCDLNKLYAGTCSRGQNLGN